MRIKNIIKKVLSEKNYKWNKLITSTNLRQLIEQISLSSTRNIYFISVDLENGEDLKLIEQIHAFDKQGSLVLFVTHEEKLEVLYQHKLEVLDYLVQGAQEEEYREKIASIYDFCFTRWCAGVEK
jgi:DNA-binding NtrC family response regulator